MKRKVIYGESYKVEPDKPENPAVTELRRRREERQRTPQTEARRVGKMLREERAAKKRLQRELETLREENRRLKEALAKYSQRR